MFANLGKNHLPLMVKKGQVFINHIKDFSVDFGSG